AAPAYKHPALFSSRSLSPPIACPHTRPPGSFAQFSSAREGLGAALGSSACARPADKAIVAATATPSINLTRSRISHPPFADCTCAVLGQLEPTFPHVHFRRCSIARPITQSLSLSLRKLSSSVNCVMRWR